MNKREVVLIGTLPPELGSQNYGGVARIVWNLAVTLKKKEVDLKIGCIGKYFKKYQKRKGIEIYGIGFSFVAFLQTFQILLSKRWWFSSCAFRHIAKLFYAVYYLLYLKRKVHFDVIHVHHVINQIPLAARLIGLDAKIIATIHSYSTLLTSDCPKEKKNITLQLNQVDFVTHVSKSVRKQGIDLGVTWKCKDKVIYNAVDVEKLGGLNYSDKPENYICFVGLMSKRKGIEELIEGFLSLKDENLKLKIIGKGKWNEKLIESRDSRIKILGILDNSEALRHMAASKALVVPSKSESFGLVYLEALAAGTPVIGYAPILKEFKTYLNIDNELSNWMIEYDHNLHDEVDLVEKIRRSISIKDHQTYLMQKKEITQKIFDKFSWANIVMDYNMLYEHYINE